MTLARLNVSGSGQFTETGLPVLLARLCKVHPLRHLIVYDMRQEPHMFVDGHAVGLYEPADMFSCIDADQWQAANGLQMMVKAEHGARSLKPFDSVPVDQPRRVVSEPEACAAACARCALCRA